MSYKFSLEITGLCALVPDAPWPKKSRELQVLLPDVTEGRLSLDDRRTIAPHFPMLVFCLDQVENPEVADFRFWRVEGADAVEMGVIFLLGKQVVLPDDGGQSLELSTGLSHVANMGKLSSLDRFVKHSLKVSPKRKLPGGVIASLVTKGGVLNPGEFARVGEGGEDVKWTFVQVAGLKRREWNDRLLRSVRLQFKEACEYVDIYEEGLMIVRLKLKQDVDVQVQLRNSELHALIARWPFPESCPDPDFEVFFDMSGYVIAPGSPPRQVLRPDCPPVGFDGAVRKPCAPALFDGFTP